MSRWFFVCVAVTRVCLKVNNAFPHYRKLHRSQMGIKVVHDPIVHYLPSECGDLVTRSSIQESCIRYKLLLVF